MVNTLFCDLSSDKTDDIYIYLLLMTLYTP